MGCCVCMCIWTNMYVLCICGGSLYFSSTKIFYGGIYALNWAELNLMQFDAFWRQFQSILIHRNSGFKGVRVLFNRKLGSKICKKIFETWRRCNFSSCIFLTRLRLMGFVNFLIFFVFFTKILIFYQPTTKIAPFNLVHQDLSIGTFSAFRRTNWSNHYWNIEIFGDFPYLRHASSDRHV